MWEVTTWSRSQQEGQGRSEDTSGCVLSWPPLWPQGACHLGDLLKRVRLCLRNVCQGRFPPGWRTSQWSFSPRPLRPCLWGWGGGPGSVCCGSEEPQGRSGGGQSVGSGVEAEKTRSDASTQVTAPAPIPAAPLPPLLPLNLNQSLCSRPPLCLPDSAHDFCCLWPPGVPSLSYSFSFYFTKSKYLVFWNSSPASRGCR